MAEAFAETGVTPPTTDGDHERFARHLKKSDIVRANAEGLPVVAT